MVTVCIEAQPLLVIMRQSYFHKCFLILKSQSFLAKTAAIIKHALAPVHKALHDMSFFSIQMDESNDKTDKSCIILVRVLDLKVEDVRTRHWHSSKPF